MYQEFGADMYLSGHMHIYERIHPVLNGTTHYANTTTQGQVYVNPNMPVHAVQATAGIFQVCIACCDRCVLLPSVSSLAVCVFLS